MIPPFAPDMVSDFPAAIHKSALPGPVGRRAYLSLVSCITPDALIVIFPALPAKPLCDEMDPFAAPSRDKNRSRTFMMMSPALPKPKLSRLGSRHSSSSEYLRLPSGHHPGHL